MIDRLYAVTVPLPPFSLPTQPLFIHPQNRVLAARFASLGLPAPLLVIEAADLGTAPPRVQGARVLSPYADVTPLEMSVAWGSNARLRAALCFPVAGAVVVRVPCEVQDVVFLGTVRALVR